MIFYTNNEQDTAKLSLSCSLHITGCVSELGDFATLFFFWFISTGADVAIAILLPTLTL